MWASCRSCKHWHQTAQGPSLHPNFRSSAWRQEWIGIYQDQRIKSSEWNWDQYFTSKSSKLSIRGIKLVEVSWSSLKSGNHSFQVDLNMTATKKPFNGFFKQSRRRQKNSSTMDTKVSTAGLVPYGGLYIHGYTVRCFNLEKVSTSNIKESKL